MNSTARDVLTVIGVGLQRGIIKSPDIEMMYSDGPKRVRLIDMVAHALESLPPAPSSADVEAIPEPPRAPLTPMTAHPALAAAADYTEKCAAWEGLAFGTRAYYDALAACDAAWERIAAACGVSADVRTALDRFNESAADLANESPLERLRYFLSLALNGQDWLDVEPFLDALGVGEDRG